ncbi:prominin-1 [Exaiptasia diaphana]|nr:prominin-1 [Exaiptasia diaphana]
MSDILRGCGKEETIWRLLKLDQKFNIQNMTSYRDKWPSVDSLLEAINQAIPSSFKIPPMDEIFNKLNATVANVSIVTEELGKNLNDSLEANVHSIDFNKFKEQIGLPLVAVSIVQFSSNLSFLSTQARSSSEAIADNLEFLSNRLEEIQEDTIDASLTLVSILKAKVLKLEEKANETLHCINNVLATVHNVDKFLQNDALVLANKAARSYINRVLSWIDQYLKDAMYKVNNRVGECSSVKKAYDASTTAFCETFLSPVNALWLSLGTIAVFSLISIILCVRLAKHYRRAERSSRSAKVATYGVPLALFTSNAPNRRTNVNPWRRVNKNTPVPNVVDRMRWV